MTEALERRAIAFIRTVASRCERCLRRSPDNCRGCISQWANGIMRDYESETDSGRQQPDYSLVARRMRIIDALEQAGRPLLACEIDLSALCSKGLKQWTLRRMVKAGKIVRVLNDDPGDERHIYLYALPKRHRKNNNNQPKEQHGKTIHGGNATHTAK